MSDSATGASRARWDGRFFLDIGRALYLGKVFETSRHAHHAIQVCVGLKEPVSIRVEVGQPWHRYEAVVIRADAPHELVSDGRTMALLFIEPEGHDGHRLELLTGEDPVAPLPQEQARRLRAIVRSVPTASMHRLPWPAVVRELLGAIGLESSPRRELHPCIARALTLLRATVGDLPRSVDLARDVNLSSDRFRHLFARELGLSYRRYRLWLRLKTAIDGMGKGAPLTAVAHAAGFADSAHLARTFRQMFGIAPSSAPSIVRMAQPGTSSTGASRRTGFR